MRNLILLTVVALTLFVVLASNRFNRPDPNFHWVVCESVQKSGTGDILSCTRYSVVPTEKEIQEIVSQHTLNKLTLMVDCNGQENVVPDIGTWLTGNCPSN